MQREARTCRQCRARKVRCDGKREICGQCGRLGFECSFQFYGEESHADQGSQHPYRTRVTRACTTCHSLKARCSGDTPACARCARKGVTCLYPPKGSKYPTRHSRTPHQEAQSGVGSHSEDFSETIIETGSNGPVSCPSTLTSAELSHIDSSAVLTDDRVKPALENFFAYMHRLPTLSFLHKASLLQLYRRGQADEALLLAIIAITSRLPGIDASQVTLATRCAETAEGLVMANLNQPSIFKVQALMLTVQYRIWTGSASNAFVLLALLARLAFILQLNHESPRLSSFIQESRRRLMWAIYVIDTTLARGLQNFKLCPANSIQLRLPCREDEFELDWENETQELQHGANITPPQILGILAYHIRIVHICDRIRRYTKQVTTGKVDVSAIPASIAALEKELDDFASHLPPAEAFSEKNLRLRAYSRALPRYVMTHIWWHQCYCDLFRWLIPDLQESASQTHLGQVDHNFLMEGSIKCIKHARSIAEICFLVLKLDCDVLILGIEIAECAYQAAQILCYGCYMKTEGKTITVEEFQSWTESCLSLIKRISGMYPALSSMESDLEKLVRSSQTPWPNDIYGIREMIAKPSPLLQVQFEDDSCKLEMHLHSTSDNHFEISESSGITQHRLIVENENVHPDIQLNPNRPAFSIRGDAEQAGPFTSNIGLPAELWDSNSGLQTQWDSWPFFAYTEGEISDH